MGGLNECRGEEEEEKEKKTEKRARWKGSRYGGGLSRLPNSVTRSAG